MKTPDLPERKERPQKPNALITDFSTGDLIMAQTSALAFGILGMLGFDELTKPRNYDPATLQKVIKWLTKSPEGILLASVALTISIGGLFYHAKVRGQWERTQDEQIDRNQWRIRREKGYAEFVKIGYQGGYSNDTREDVMQIPYNPEKDPYLPDCIRQGYKKLMEIIKEHPQKNLLCTLKVRTGENGEKTLIWERPAAEMKQKLDTLLNNKSSEEIIDFKLVEEEIKKLHPDEAK